VDQKDIYAMISPWEMQEEDPLMEEEDLLAEENLTVVEEEDLTVAEEEDPQEEDFPEVDLQEEDNL